MVVITADVSIDITDNTSVQGTLQKQTTTGYYTEFPNEVSGNGGTAHIQVTASYCTSMCISFAVVLQFAMCCMTA